MKTFNTIYESYESLKNFIDTHKINVNKNEVLVQIFSGICEKSHLQKIASEVKGLVSNSKIIGTTTSGEIIDCKVSLNKTIISFSIFNSTTLKSVFLNNCGNSFDLGINLCKEILTENTKLIILFSDGLNTNGSDILKGIDSVSSNIPVAGGRAGDNGYMIDTYIFNEDNISNNGIVAVSLNSSALEVYNNYSMCWQPIGKIMTVTKAVGNRVYTIDNIPAKEIYRKYLGYDVTSRLPKSATEFPLIIHKNNLKIARVAFYDYRDDSLGFIGNVDEGDKVTFGFGNIDMLIERSTQIMESINKVNLESIFIYSCTARKVYMQEKIDVELLPLKDIANVSGYFTYGEYYYNNPDNLLLNITTTILGLSENTIDKVNPKRETCANYKQPVKINMENFVDGKETEIIKVLNNLINTVTNELEEINKDLQEKNLEIKKNQDIFVEMEKATNMVTLLSGIVHNLKTPLMGCSGANDIIVNKLNQVSDKLSSLNNDVAAKDILNILKDINLWYSRIEEYLNYIGDVINTIRDYVYSESEIAFFTIDTLVHRISILMENRLKENKCSIKYIFDIPNCYELYGEINYLIQAIINLIDNSIDAYEGKAGIIEFRIAKEDENIIFSIKDFGIGISEEVSKRLFYEMITTKGRNGSGLGLYISQIHIRSKFKGNIILNSNIANATEFVIKIPIRSNA
jgi:hypothetical protein